MIAAANIFVMLLGIYVAAGVLFALVFVFRGVNVIDPVAKESTWGFRLIILPGVVALWPLMASRWMRKKQPPRECTAHKISACRGGK